VQALVLGATLYPGVGTRSLQPEAQRERWYQHFHTLAQADQIIGHDRETVRLYLSHFYDHWVGNKQSLRPKEFDAIVEMYTQPGAVRGSIAWYRAGAGSGQIVASPSPEDLLPIQQPTTVVWGEKDPILLSTWTDRLEDCFSRLLRIQILPGIGHFVPFEAPDVLVEAIRSVI
jgi:pimeloyl-ACP methyl ester carboxylesterase